MPSAQKNGPAWRSLGFLSRENTMDLVEAPGIRDLDLKTLEHRTLERGLEAHAQGRRVGRLKAGPGGVFTWEV